MLHHGLFSKGRNFAIADLGIFVGGLVFFASNNYFAFEISTLYTFDQFKSGLYFTVAWYFAIIATCVTGVYCSHTKIIRLSIALAFGSFTTFNALMTSLSGWTHRNAAGYAVLMGISLGTALNGLITVAQLSTPPELLSITPGLMVTTRSSAARALSDNLPTKVAAAAIPLGLKPGNLPALIAGLTGCDRASLSRIPNVTPKLLQAAGLAVQSCYVLSFRYVWATALAFSVIALIVAGFLFEPKTEFTYHIDAPVETEAELNRPAITEKIRA